MSTIDSLDAMPTMGRALRRPREAVADGRWVRPALIALLVLTAVAYLVDLSASGYANSFYAAAVEAGTKSWKAFFYGSIDSSSFITTDKPPGLDLGDGAFRAHFRLQQLEHACAPRRSRGWPPSRFSTPRSSGGLAPSRGLRPERCSP